MKYFIAVYLIIWSVGVCAQKDREQLFKGTLFIIGGGSRSPNLIKTMLATARLKDKDYVVILPMSGEDPDTSFYYIQKDLVPFCKNTIANLNFTQNNLTDKVWLDSLRNAKLIFITGGDQNRFMDIVSNTPVHEAVKYAYANGSTVAGTSAGAAVMSKKMITGNELFEDSVRSGLFKKIQYDMVQVKEGLGLIRNAIIDQHFIVRSRYNRLLSVLAEFPSYDCIGIDEGTAVIVKGNKLTVTGSSQVIRITLRDHRNIPHLKNSIVKLHNLRLDIYTEGDSFELK